MKAWVLHGIGDLRLDERPVPKPKAGEVLLEVKAAGICGSDIPRIYETGAHVHPIIPGHEFAGVVVESKDRALIGKRAGVYPLIPCMDCEMCRQKRYEVCRNYGYLGSRRDGAFAEYVCVPAGNLIELSDKVSFEQGACLEPLSVAVHAVRRAKVTAEDSAAVIGLGAVGLFVTELLLDKGMKKLTVVGNKDIQRQKALELGLSAECYQDTREAAFSADVVFECVGRAETAALAIESAAPEGRVVLMGNPRSDMTFPRQIYWKILRNQLAVWGTWNSTFIGEETDDWHTALRFLQKRDMVSKIISHRFPLKELDKGFHIMRDKTEGYGRIMMIR